VITHRCGVEFASNRAMAEESFDLGRKDERPTIVKVVNGLDAEAIPRQHYESLACVVYRKCKHATEMDYAVLSPFRIRDEDCLGVGRRTKEVAAFLKLRAELPIVIYLTVEGDPQRTICIAHWLRAAGEIDDREAPMGEPDVVDHLEPVS